MKNIYKTFAIKAKLRDWYTYREPRKNIPAGFEEPDRENYRKTIGRETLAWDWDAKQFVPYTNAFLMTYKKHWPSPAFTVVKSTPSPNDIHFM